MSTKVHPETHNAYQKKNNNNKKRQIKDNDKDNDKDNNEVIKARKWTDR